jgi:hypothetical protein
VPSIEAVSRLQQAVRGSWMIIKQVCWSLGRLNQSDCHPV